MAVAEAPHTLISIDAETGLVRAPASLTLEAVLAVIVPRGLFLPVTPGTALATIGGAVAADVHGKNHHRDGCLGAHITEIELVTPTGRTLVLGPTDPRFQATVGGMGLTGLITSVQFRAISIETPLVVADYRPTADLDQTLSALREADSCARYSVAWVDLLGRRAGLGRGVVITGDHATRDEARDLGCADALLAYRPSRALKVPLRMPINVLSKSGVALFNSAYYASMARRQSDTHLAGVASFFHPLDAIRDWNLLYGPSGFIQYQFVVPDSSGGVRALQQIVELVAQSPFPGFLSVLKRFGEAGLGMLSFPKPGWTLTIDIPCGHSGLRGLVRRLDDLVVREGGRVYLAKDATSLPEIIEHMYPRLPEWREVQAELDPAGTMQSDLSRRLCLTARTAG